MAILFLIVIAMLFIAFVALAFSVLTLFLGTLSESFQVTGPEGWTFFDFYKRYLIVAAVYTFVYLPLRGCVGFILAFLALSATYKYVFDADWVVAFWVGVFGGGVATVLFLLLIIAVLSPLGLIPEAEPSPREFDLESFEEFEEQSYHPMAPGAVRGTHAMLAPACIAPPVGGSVSVDVA